MRLSLFGANRFTRAKSVHAKLRVERLEPRELMSADMVTQWNDTTLDAIRTAGSLPPVAARNLAMVHTAIYDAVNAIVATHKPYELEAVAPPTASREAAVNAAAARVLRSLYPAQASTFNAAETDALDDIPDGLDQDAGVRIGQLAADAILALRSADGSTDTVAYTPGTDLGDWQPTPPGNAAAVLPQWSEVQPFALTSAGQFSGTLGDGQIPAIDSPEYTAAYEEVKAIGSTTSTSRTVEQTQIANFWANGLGTATPPGHLNRMAQAISEARNSTLVDNARLFALLNVAMADTAIAAWDLKFDTNFWRPVTAIRGGEADGNSSTIGDSDWTPLLVTPPFPSYVSGHASFSGAAASVLSSFYGSDDISFTLESETDGVADRSYTKISQAAEESAASRLYGGVHWGFDNRDGLLLGDSIGDFVSTNLLTSDASTTPVGVYDGVLVVVGTSNAEKIKVILKGSQLEVTINGKSKGRFALSTIQSISIDAKGGNDLVELVGRIITPASIEGGDGADRLIGGFGNDTINGGAGKDFIFGRRGNDRLFGGDGNDLIHGDEGNDEISGGAGHDRLLGGAGADVINGDGGNDKIMGGSGHDTLSGDDGDDEINGEGGRDMLFGGLGNDLLIGGGQKDVFDGGPGRNKQRR